MNSNTYYMDKMALEVLANQGLIWTLRVIANAVKASGEDNFPNDSDYQAIVWRDSELVHKCADEVSKGLDGKVRA